MTVRTENRSFTLSRTISETHREGWGVDCMTVHDGESDTVVDVDVSVMPIREDLAKLIGGVWCVPVPGTSNYWVPISNFRALDDLWEDDSHDLRTRWFPTEDLARRHADTVIQTWQHPSPWVSFVRMDGDMADR